MKTNNKASNGLAGRAAIQFPSAVKELQIKGLRIRHPKYAVCTEKTVQASSSAEVSVSHSMNRPLKAKTLKRIQGFLELRLL